MASIKPHEYHPDEWDDHEDEPRFQRLHKQTGKPQTLKDERKQQAKEWGRSIHKVHKQRQKNGKP